MNSNENSIFIGTRGVVTGIDQNSGKDLWRTQLPGSMSAPVTMFFEDGKVFAGSNGIVYILCSKSGIIIGQNDLVGQGYGTITFTTKKTEADQQPQQMNEQNHQQPFMLQQNIQQPLYQPVQQQMLFEQSQTQNIQQPLVSQMYPIFPSNVSSQNEESQRLLEEDEEFARSLDRELNGNQNHRNNNYLNNGHNRLININRSNSLSNLNNNHYNINSLIRHDLQFFENRINIQEEISMDDIIFVGLNAFVTALNKNTGREIWRAYVPVSLGMPLSLVYTNGKINVASCGFVFCLNAYTGKEMWRNNLPGLRYSNVSIANNETSYNANSTQLYNVHN